MITNNRPFPRKVDVYNIFDDFDDFDYCEYFTFSFELLRASRFVKPFLLI